MVALGELSLLLAISLLALGGLLLIPFGLPGNWLIALCALPGAWLGWGWWPFAIQIGLAGLAELLEFTSALKHARRTGATRAGSWGGIFGSIVGAIMFTGLVPIPIVGTVLGAALGAFAGAFLVELTFAGRSEKDSMRAGWGAFLGTLIGKALKIALGAVQLVLLFAHIFGLLTF